MRGLTIVMSALVMLGLVAGARGEEKQAPPASDRVVWGQPVKGLQLGIELPAAEKKAEASDNASGWTVHIHLRNVGETPARLLPTVHRCVAMGPGGAAAMLVSQFNMTPVDDRKVMMLTYEGANHLRLLDVRRDKSQSWQKAVANDTSDPTDIQLSDEDVAYMSLALKPGEHARVRAVTCSPSDDNPPCPWRVNGEPDIVPAGKYQLAAVLKIDHKQSAWKGTLKSGSVIVEMPDKPKQ